MMSNWRTKKLSNVISFISTGAHSRNDMTSATDDPDQVFNIHYGDIHTKYSTYVNFDKDKVPVLKNNNIRETMLLREGDLVVADASEDYDGVGAAIELRNIGTRKVIGGLHTFALRGDKNDFAPGFLGLVLKNPLTRKRLMQRSVYSKVYGLTKSSIESIDISYPEKPEQERIVAVLEVWDEYIEKLEQKIALKEQLKRGLMQQLLAQSYKNGSMVQLGSIVDLLKDGTHGTHKNVDEGSDLLSAKDIKGGKVVRRADSRKISMQDFNQIHKTYNLKEGDILLTIVGTLGRVAQIRDYRNDYTFQRSVAIFRFSEHVNNRFMYYLLSGEAFKKELLKR